MRHIRQVHSDNPDHIFHSNQTDFVINRHKFLKLILKTSAVTYIAMNAAGCETAEKPPVTLRKLSNRVYENITIIGEFYLKDLPFENFNIGQALDQFLYAAPNPHPMEKMLLELLSIPSSVLAMIYVDKSVIPMIYMNKSEREKIFLKWRTSDDHLQRGIYAIMHSVCMTLLSTYEAYPKYTGMEI